MTDQAEDGGVLPLAPQREPAAEVGGEEACWMNRVCPECGALKETPAEKCWRCGSEGSSY
ncbi:hypothetical protein [Rothia aerolata]|uniref:Uncharacterized protein n=1 Tax=Rothia aerolata TaxID=1812262 RepID=A0A917J070_9MICC|nr:hypothetical protein [Rothia aerolata]GGH66759.1 hypothetical protein GCM10007359_21210 [Rothia aerolata]